MFRLFTKHREKVKKYLLIFFLSIVSIGMVITLAPLPGGNTQDNSNVLATVAGDKITTDDLRQSIETQMRNSQLGDDARIVPAIANSILDSMVTQRAMVSQAQKMGLEVSNQELRAALENLPWLYRDGKFVGMANYQSIIQQETGLSTQAFEEQYRESILLNKLRDVVSDGVEVTPAEVHEQFVRQDRKAKVRYVVFDPSKFLQQVQIEPSALQAFFDKDPGRYKVPEERQVRYVIISPDVIRSKINVTAQEMQDYYTAHLSDYRVPDRVKLAQILFKTTGKTPAEVAAIQKTARDVLAKIQAGASFPAMAQQNSEDASAQNGGEMGWLTRDQLADNPTLGQAAFSLKPGQVSGLITSSYGVQIIKVEDRQTAHLQTFDEAKNSIQPAMEKQKLEAGLHAFADGLQAQLKANPGQFDSTVKQAGLQTDESGLFKYNQTIPDFGTSEAFHNLAFELQANEIGQPISVPKGAAIIQVTKIVPAHVPTLAEVQADVEEDYRAVQSKVLTSQKAQEFGQAAKNGDFQKIAKQDGYTVQESKDFTAQDYVQGLGTGPSLESAFTLKPGETSGVVSAQGNEAVFQVISQTPANESDFAAKGDQIQEQLLDQRKNVAYEIYRQNLKQQLMRSGKLKINQAALKTFIASYAQQ